MDFNSAMLLLHGGHVSSSGDELPLELHKLVRLMMLARWKGR